VKITTMFVMLLKHNQMFLQPDLVLIIVTKMQETVGVTHYVLTGMIVVMITKMFV
jgi:hypothetical protein